MLAEVASCLSQALWPAGWVLGAHASPLTVSLGQSDCTGNLALLQLCLPL